MVAEFGCRNWLNFLVEEFSLDLRSDFIDLPIQPIVSHPEPSRVRYAFLSNFSILSAIWKAALLLRHPLACSIRCEIRSAERTTACPRRRPTFIGSGDSFTFITSGIRTVQKFPGHSSEETTMIYTHVMNKGGRGVFSPPDKMAPGFS